MVVYCTRNRTCAPHWPDIPSVKPAHRHCPRYPSHPHPYHSIDSRRIAINHIDCNTWRCGQNFAPLWTDPMTIPRYGRRGTMPGYSQSVSWATPYWSRSPSTRKYHDPHHFPHSRHREYGYLDLKRSQNNPIHPRRWRSGLRSQNSWHLRWWAYMSFFGGDKRNPYLPGSCGSTTRPSSHIDPYPDPWTNHWLRWHLKWPQVILRMDHTGRIFSRTWHLCGRHLFDQMWRDLSLMRSRDRYRSNRWWPHYTRCVINQHMTCLDVLPLTSD